MWNHPHDQGPYLATTGEQHAANSATDQEAAKEAERTGEAAGREAEEAEKPQQGGRSKETSSKTSQSLSGDHSDNLGGLTYQETGIFTSGY